MYGINNTPDGAQDEGEVDGRRRKARAKHVTGLTWYRPESGAAYPSQACAESPVFTAVAIGREFFFVLLQGGADLPCNCRPFEFQVNQRR